MSRAKLPRIRQPRNFFLVGSRTYCKSLLHCVAYSIETAMSMITASLWVPRGAAAAFPEKYDVDEDELARISKLAKLQLDDANEGLEDARNGHQAAIDTEDSDEEENGVKVRESHK